MSEEATFWVVVLGLGFLGALFAVGVVVSWVA